MIDTHCHIQFKAFEKDRERVIQKCANSGIILNVVGTQADTSKYAVELAESHDHIYATVGLHPIQHHKVKVEEEDTEFIARGENFDSTYFEGLIESSAKVIAVGETGLDAYHVPSDQSLQETLDEQWKLFVDHAELAEKHDLPLVIHVRDAHDQMIERLRKHPHRSNGGTSLRATVHCFTGNWQQAQEYLDMGFYLGFTGVVTFPPRKTNPKPQAELLDVIEKIPLNKMLVETDAPYLAPQKYRGKRCEPWMVSEVVDKIAELRGLKNAELAQIAVENAEKLFTRIVRK